MTPATTGLTGLGEREHRDLDASQLRKDMLSLWREEGAAAGKQGAVTRACLSTLVLPAGSEDDVDTLLSDVIPRYPSRVVLVRADPQRPAGTVEAWVSGTCFRKPGGRSLVCCETVNMLAGPQTDHRTASAIRSLRVGGVPMFVVSPWVSPLEIDWIVRLGDLVDAVVADSSRMSVERAMSYWGRCASREEGPGYGDALWVGLGDWRRAIALWFDRREENQRLRSITRVTVEVTDTPGGMNKALLLIGWLASRLSWSPASVGGDRRGRFTFQGPAGAVVAEVQGVKAQGDPALILSVAMERDGVEGGPVWRRLSRESAIVVETGRGGSRFRLNQTKTSAAEAVLEFLHRHQRDPVARQAMLLAMRLGGARDTQ